jgi:hypothetical protein
LVDNAAFVDQVSVGQKSFERMTCHLPIEWRLCFFYDYLN